MKYFCLSLLSLFLSYASFAISPIKGSAKVCTGTTTQLSDATPGGTWISSASYIADVGSTGIVTGVAVGTAIITYDAGGVNAMVTVSVNPVSAVLGNTTICAGLTTLLSDATLGGTWSSSNTSIAITGTTLGVEKVTTVAAGTDTIFYTLPSGCVASAVLLVNPLPATITGTTNVCEYQTTALSDASFNGTWSSSIPAVAKVDGLSGVVTGSTPGIVIITYTLPTGCISIATVTVNALPAPILGTPETYTGNTTTLTDATLGGIWSASYPSVASVSAGGVVTGVATTSADEYIYYTLPATGCFVITKFSVNPFPDSGFVFPVSAWYPFCADTTDHSGNGVNMTIHNAGYGIPALTTDTFGYPNAAYEFKAATNTMMSRPIISIATPTGDFSYFCRMNPDLLTGNQSAIIMYNGDPTADGFGFIMAQGPLGTPGIDVGVLLGGYGNYTPWPLAGGLGKWHGLLLVKSGNEYTFYVDDYLVGSFVNAVNAPSNGGVGGGGFTVGNTRAFTGAAFTGGIDDIAVFNEALTDRQRDALFNFNPDAPLFSLGPDTVLCGGSITLTPVPQTFGSYYTWTTGDTVDTSIVVIPALKGTSTYSLSVTRPFACTVTDGINIRKNPLAINLGVDTNICIGDTIVLNATYSHSTYVWNTGDVTPMLKVFNTGTFWVTVDSSVCMGTDTVNVTAWRKPLVNIGADVYNCNGTPYEIHNSYPDITYDLGYTYLWSNGSSSDSLLTNTSGNFWLEVSNHGCPQTDSMKVLIVFDTFSFHTNDTAICQGRFVTASATFNPIVTYQWTPTTGIPLSNVPGPNITPDTSATYTLRGTYPGCPDIVDSFHIDVQPYPMVDIGGNRQVCSFDTIHISAIVEPRWFSHYIFNWSPGTSIDFPNAQNVVFTAGDSTDLILSVTTSAGCKGSDSMLVSVHPGGFDSAILNINVCPGDSVQLSTFRRTVGNTVSTLATYEWSPGIFLSDSTASMPWLRATTSARYSVIGTSSFGCKDTLSFDVVVNPGAVIYLGDSVTLHPGQTYQISPQTNCVSFRWFPPFGLDDTLIANPLASPTLSTEYIVHASTEAGCDAVDSIKIHVDPSTLLAIPNAFTPGGNVNNILYIIQDGKATLNYFRIFDRWGVKVFEATNINSGWNGEFNGAPQPFGVYVYEAEATTSTGQVFHQQGNITLIR